MPEIFNPTQFPLFIAQLGKQLAPFETAVIADADLAAKLLAPGVLKDASELEEAIQHRAHETGLEVEDLKAWMEHEIAVFHDEHSAPADHVIEDHDEPLEDIHHDAAKVHTVTPAEKIQALAGNAPVVPADAKLIDGDPENTTVNAILRATDDGTPQIQPSAGITDPADVPRVADETSLVLEGDQPEVSPDDGPVS